VEHRPGSLADYAVSMGDGIGNKGDSHGEDNIEPNGAFRHAISPPCHVVGADTRFPGNYKSRTSFKRITDGLSKTIFVGEKHLTEAGIGKKDSGDNSIYNPDYVRAFARCGSHEAPLGFSRDESGGYQFFNFGSWHTDICNFMFGDGSVRSIGDSIEPAILGYLCNIRDGQVVDLEQD
jgi:hypothetical protein